MGHSNSDKAYTFKDLMSAARFVSLRSEPEEVGVDNDILAHAFFVGFSSGGGAGVKLICTECRKVILWKGVAPEKMLLMFTAPTIKRSVAIHLKDEHPDIHFEQMLLNNLVEIE